MMADLRRLGLGVLLLVIAMGMPYHYAVLSTLFVSLALIAGGIGIGAWDIAKWINRRGDH